MHPNSTPFQQGRLWEHPRPRPRQTGVLFERSVSNIKPLLHRAVPLLRPQHRNTALYRFETATPAGALAAVSELA
eukprot:364672-Chlamydomonas_euryale.AAC.2